jgi:hypothetical protein
MDRSTDSHDIPWIAQSVWKRAIRWKAKVRVPVGLSFCLIYSIHTGSGAHPASYPMGTGGSFPRVKAARE